MDKPQTDPNIAPPGEEDVRVNAGICRSKKCILFTVIATIIGITLYLAYPAIDSTVAPILDVKLHRLNQVKLNQLWENDTAPIVEVDYEMPYGLFKKKCGIWMGDVHDYDSRIGKETVRLQVVYFEQNALEGVDRSTIRKRLELAGFRVANTRELIAFASLYPTRESIKDFHERTRKDIFSIIALDFDEDEARSLYGIAIPSLSFERRSQDFMYFKLCGTIFQNCGLDRNGFLVIYK